MFNDTKIISHDPGCEMRQYHPMGSHNLGQKHRMAGVQCHCTSYW